MSEAAHANEFSTEIATPHINPKGAEIAETILLPGDPLRAKFIADTFLEDVVQFNEVRNILGFTGTYQGHRVSVMGTGMGMPSIGIYSWELIHNYGVKNLIRVGSIGALQEDIDLHDVIVASAASTDSNFLSQYNLPGQYSPTASWKLLKGLVDEAEKQDAHIHVGNVLSSDVFYNFDQTVNDRWAHMGVLGVEMESAALYATAAEAGVNALGLFTVSDNIAADTHLSAAERQTAFHTMMKLALPLAGLD